MPAPISTFCSIPPSGAGIRKEGEVKISFRQPETKEICRLWSNLSASLEWPFKTIKIINIRNYLLRSHSIMHCGPLTQMQLEYAKSFYWPTAFPQHLLCPCSILTNISELTPAKIDVRILSCLLMVIRQLTLTQLSFGDF